LSVPCVLCFFKSGRKAADFSAIFLKKEAAGTLLNR